MKKIYGVDEHWRDECSVQEYESKTITAGDNVYEGVDLTSCILYYKDLEDKNENQVVDEKEQSLRNSNQRYRKTDCNVYQF